MNLPAALRDLDGCTTICGSTKDEVRGLLYALAGKREPKMKGKPKLGQWVRFSYEGIVNGTGRVVALTGSVAGNNFIVVAFPAPQQKWQWWRFIPGDAGSSLAKQYGYPYGFDVQDGCYKVVRRPHGSLQK